MSKTASDILHYLVHGIDADDVGREIDYLDDTARRAVWDQALEEMRQVRPDTDRKSRLRFVLQVFVADSTPPEKEPRLATKDVLQTIIDQYEGYERVCVQRVIDQVDRRNGEST